MFIEHPLPIVSAAASRTTPLVLAKASTSFLLAVVNKVTEAVSNRLAAVSAEVLWCHLTTQALGF